MLKGLRRERAIIYLIMTIKMAIFGIKYHYIRAIPRGDGLYRLSHLNMALWHYLIDHKERPWRASQALCHILERYRKVMIHEIYR